MNVEGRISQIHLKIKGSFTFHDSDYQIQFLLNLTSNLRPLVHLSDILTLAIHMWYELDKRLEKRV